MLGSSVAREYKFPMDFNWLLSFCLTHTHTDRVKHDRWHTEHARRTGEEVTVSDRRHEHDRDYSDPSSDRRHRYASRCATDVTKLAQATYTYRDVHIRYSAVPLHRSV